MSNFPPIVPRYKALQNIFKVLRNPIPVLQSYQKNYGDTFAFFVGGKTCNIVSTNPEFCQHVLQKNHRKYEKSELQTVLLGRFLGKGLLTSNGDYWLQQRRLIQPGFHREKLAALTSLMNSEIDTFITKLDVAAEKNQAVDVYEEGLAMAFNIMVRSLFTDNMKDGDRHSLAKDLTEVQEFLVKQIRLPFLNWYFKMSGQVQKAKANAHNSQKILRSLIEKRRIDTEKYDDLLDMLLAARYEDNGEGMNDAQLLAETQVLFAAGHETSANSIAWTLYLLEQHPEVVAKLRAEFKEVLDGRPPSFTDLRQLTYTLQVINESMRLYPPAWITDRVALEDDEVAGFHIPKGTIVTPFIYGVHHSDGLWKDPEAFCPERFGKTQQRERANFAYFPFGGGPRLCIGNNFALMEMQLILAHLIQRYDLELVKNQIIEQQPLVTLRPRNGILMKFKKRF